VISSTRSNRTIVAVSCKTSRFSETLVKGGSLYGVGVGCAEWRAAVGDEASPEGVLMRGNLRAVLAHEGRMYSFSYDLFEEHGAVRLSIAGRGSSSSVPGVLTLSADGVWGVSGSATYCVESVDVLASPVTADAVLVGDETWFMTKEACQKHRLGLEVLRCSSRRKRTK
jgi:hypothetical protein